MVNLFPDTPPAVTCSRLVITFYMHFVSNSAPGASRMMRTGLPMLSTH
jgi:hypothetical protein